MQVGRGPYTMLTVPPKECADFQTCFARQASWTKLQIWLQPVAMACRVAIILPA